LADEECIMVRWAGDTIELEDIEQRIDAAAFDPDRWTDVAEDIATILPGVRVVFQALYDDSPDHCTLVNVGWSTSDANKYFEHFGNINPWVDSWRAAAVGIPVMADHTLPRSELVRTEFYNDWLKVIGEADGATGIKIAHGHGKLANVAVHYDYRRSAEIHPMVARTLRRLSPRLARSLEANRLLAEREVARQMKPVIDRFRHAAIALDHGGKIVATNPSADTLVKDGGFLRIGPGDILHFTDTADDRGFRQRLTSVFTPELTASTVPQDMIVGRGMRYTASLLAFGSGLDRRMPGSFLPFQFEEMLCLLVFRQANGIVANCRTPMAAIERYRLTRSEAKVVLELCQGGPLREIATRLDIAYDTLRTHLKRIYEKSGARTQRDLVQLFMRIP
jgi:DNA-binding CsgD family transcriptional regulator